MKLEGLLQGHEHTPVSLRVATTVWIYHPRGWRCICRKVEHVADSGASTPGWKTLHPRAGYSREAKSGQILRRHHEHSFIGREAAELRWGGEVPAIPAAGTVHDRGWAGDVGGIFYQADLPGLVMAVTGNAPGCANVIGLTQVHASRRARSWER